MLFFFSLWIWTFSLFYKAGREEQPSPVEFDCLFVENTCQFLTNRWDKKTKLATFIKHPLISFSWLPLTAKKTQISASPVSAALHQCVNSHLRCALLHFISLRLAELMCKRGLTVLGTRHPLTGNPLHLGRKVRSSELPSSWVFLEQETWSCYVCP